MMGFPNIYEILDFLLANLGIPDKSMISGRFPHAKLSENRNFSPRNFSPKPKTRSWGKKSFSEKSFSGASFAGEMFLGGKSPGEMFLEGKGFRSVRISQICSDFWISGIAELPGHF